MNLRKDDSDNRFGYIGHYDWLDGSAYKYYTYLMSRYGGVLLNKKGSNLSKELKELRPNLVFCHGDWMGNWYYANKLKIPYVLVEHDVYSLRKTPSIGEAEAERKMVESAQAILYTSEDHQEYIESKYKAPPGWVIHLRPLASDVAFEPTDKKLKGKHLVYAGGIVRESQATGLYGYRSYHDIFQTFIDAGWTVHIYGCRGNSSSVGDYRKAGYEVHDPLPYQQLLRDMGKYTAGLLGYSKEGTPKRAFAYTQTCRPNKTWDYLAAGIPTIAIQAGNASKIVAGGGWGVSVPLDVGALKNICDKLPKITNKMRFEQVMDRDGEKFQELVNFAVSRGGKIVGVSCFELEDIEGGRIVMADGKKWFVTTERVIEKGRLLYGRNRRIPYAEAVRLGLVGSKKPGPLQNKVVEPSENKELEEHFCGALTKSGESCKARVKNKGDRCKRHDMPFVREGEHTPVDMSMSDFGKQVREEQKQEEA